MDTVTPTKPLPPTGAALLRVLMESGGSLPYLDPRVTVSGLTALRHRGLARVATARFGHRRVVLTEAGVDAGRAALSK